MICFFRLWSKNHDFNLEEMLKEIAFYKGLNYYLLQTCGTDRSNPNCPNGNFSYYANLVRIFLFKKAIYQCYSILKVRSSCDDIMDNCTWMKQPFDCCKEFKFIQTELGPCYIINSVQIQKYEFDVSYLLLINVKCIKIVEKREKII